MHDFKKLEEKFHEFLKEGINEEYFNIDEVEITEDLLEQKEAFAIPFGFVSYFLVIENEKPEIYVLAATRMGMETIGFVDENGSEAYDVYFGEHKEMSEKYYSHAKDVRDFEDLRDIRKTKK